MTLGVLLLPGSASLAQSETSHLIIAGQFGSWRLGTSEWQAVPLFTETLGPEFSIGVASSFKIYVEIHDNIVDAVGVYDPTAWVGAD